VTRELKMAAAYEKGATLQEIGDAWGVTKERVRQLLKRTDAPTPEESLVARRAARCKDALTLVRSGLNVTAAARKYGFSPGLLWEAVRDAGIKAPPRPVAKHGTESKYTLGCRCRRCKKAHADFAYLRGHRRNPSRGYRVRYTYGAI
jgi:methylphosphotriester-DNA--protein-cysteine methyltransferase